MNKRSNFYPNGEIIDYRLPQDFRPSSGKGSCGNCGQYSNKHAFCNVYGQVVVYEKKFKGTSIGKNPKKVNSMNKHKRKGRSRKQLRYRGQGK